MLIQHSNRSTAGLSHADEVYDTLGDGVFEVPDDVAAELTSFPHWSVFHGEDPRAPVVPEATDDQAYAEGFAARGAGKPRTENPYDRRKAAGKAWNRGWDEGPGEATGGGSAQ